MGMLTNSPAQTHIRLEARKSFTLGVECWTSETSKADTTDHVLTFTLRKTALKGGDLLLTRALDNFEPEHGRSLLALQAIDLDLAEDTYLWGISILTPTGYTGLLAKGELEVVENTDPATTGTYSGEGLAQSIQLILTRNNTMKLRVGRLLDFNGSISGGGGGASLLDDLTDVNVAAVSTGQILGFDGGDWVPFDMPGGGGSTVLDDNTDVEIDGFLTEFDVLMRTAGAWRNAGLRLDTHLRDVDLTGAVDGDVLTRVSGDWAPVAPTGGGVTLPIAESDVTGLVTDLANKQPLDADLTAIAALASQTAYGRNFLTLANQAALVALLPSYAPLASPTFTGTPAAPTAAPGTNTTQLATTAYADAIAALKANLASPTFTGTPAAPTPSAADSTTKIATTAFVQGEIAAKAPLASPVFTGNPTAPTPAAADNDTSIATTAFVQGELAAKAPLASPALTGNPTAPTASAGDNDTSIATTAFVAAALTKQVELLEYALSDETTAITTGQKLTTRARFGFTLNAVRASLSTVSSSGIPTLDIKKNGTTVLSTLLTIDASEKTSVTAATAAVISVPTFADDDEITFHVTVAGTGATGLKVAMMVTRT